MKATKNDLTEEKYKIDSRMSANEKIQESIESLKIRSSAWQTQKEEDSTKFEEAIAELEKVDIKAELDTHKKLQKHNEDYLKLLSLNKEKAYHEDSFTKAEANVTKTENDLEYAQQAKCPTCEQTLHDEKHKKLTSKLIKGIKPLETILDRIDPNHPPIPTPLLEQYD